MPDYEMNYIYVLEDFNGDKATMRIRNFVGDTATVADIVAQITAFGTAFQPAGTMTNAKVVRSGFSVLSDLAQTTPGSPNPPLDAWYPSVVDKAVLSFGNSMGEFSRISVPAPVEAIFHAPPSDLNVNPANTQVAAFITAYELLAHDAAHNPINLYTGGTYRGSRRRRRMGRM